jgi:hypothetical protein
MYYTGPDERFKHTADEGGPKVIVRCDVGGREKILARLCRAGIPESVLLVDRHYTYDAL